MFLPQSSILRPQVSREHGKQRRTDAADANFTSPRRHRLAFQRPTLAALFFRWSVQYRRGWKEEDQHRRENVCRCKHSAYNGCQLTSQD